MERGREGRKEKTRDEGQPLPRLGGLFLGDTKQPMRDVLCIWQPLRLTLVMPSTLLPNHQGPFPHHRRGEDGEHLQLQVAETNTHLPRTQKPYLPPAPIPLCPAQPHPSASFPSTCAMLSLPKLQCQRPAAGGTRRAALDVPETMQSRCIPGCT